MVLKAFLIQGGLSEAEAEAHSKILASRAEHEGLPSDTWFTEFSPAVTLYASKDFCYWPTPTFMTSEKYGKIYSYPRGVEIFGKFYRVLDANLYAWLFKRYSESNPDPEVRKRFEYLEKCALKYWKPHAIAMAVQENKEKGYRGLE